MNSQLITTEPKCWFPLPSKFSGVDYLGALPVLPCLWPSFLSGSPDSIPPGGLPPSTPGQSCLCVSASVKLLPGMPLPLHPSRSICLAEPDQCFPFSRRPSVVARH